MSKLDKFATLGNDSDFNVRDAISAFSSDETADRIGRTAMKNVAMIELDRIIAKDQVRKDYDEDKHRELVASLETHGQQQPIVVYWSDEDERYIVFMGHRRRRAAIEAGLQALSCVVLAEPPTEAERLEKQLVENIVREDLNPIDEAEAFDGIIQARGCTAQDLAKDLGKAASTIQRSVKLLTLPEDLREKVRVGAIPKSVARELVKLKDEPAMREMVAQYEKGGSYGQIAERVKKKPGARSASPAKTKKEFTVNGVKIVATAKKRITQADIAAALRVIVEQLESDGRSGRAA